MADILTAILLWIGALFMFISALGLVRFPDLFTRMHAAAKTGTLGIVALVVGVAVHFQTVEVSFIAFLMVTFFFITAPIASQLIGRAAYHIEAREGDYMKHDDFAAHLRARQETPGRSSEMQR